MRFAYNSDVDVVAGEIRSEVFDRVQFLETRSVEDVQRWGDSAWDGIAAFRIRCC